MMAKVGAAEGIQFDYNGLISNTEASHALIAAAAEHGGSALQDKVVEALFRFYFEAQGALGDEAAITAVCAASGLPEAVSAAALAPSARAAVRAEEREWRDKHGVSGVPFFVFSRADGSGQQVEISGAVEAPAFVEAISRLNARG
jgi:predicted DsbA family dithiol-disulfide isomerase